MTWGGLPVWLRFTISLALILLAVIAFNMVRSAGLGQSCIVTAMGGNKLCGSEAAAWCNSTDSLRALADQSDPDVQASNDACASVRK